MVNRNQMNKMTIVKIMVMELREIMCCFNTIYVILIVYHNTKCSIPVDLVVLMWTVICSILMIEPIKVFCNYLIIRFLKNLVWNLMKFN